MALGVSSDFPEAVELVPGRYDQFGFDTVDNSLLRESWRSACGTGRHPGRGDQPHRYLTTAPLPVLTPGSSDPSSQGLGCLTEGCRMLLPCPPASRSRRWA